MSSFPTGAHRAADGRHRRLWPTHGGPAQTLAVEVVELAPVAMLLVSAVGRVWLANHRAEMLTGRPAESMLGIAMTDVLELTDRAPEDRWVASAAGPGALPDRGRVRRPDGSTVAVEVRTSDLPVPSGRWSIVALNDCRPAAGEVDPGPGPGRPRAGGRPRVTEVLQQVVRPLLDAALGVQAGITQIGAGAPPCLQDAAAEIDRAIGALQDLAFPPSGGGAPPGATSGTAPPGGTTGRGSAA